MMLPIFLFGLLLFKNKPIESNIATVKKPNIILVGIDSLRPDFLSYFGGTETTPFLDLFLSQATVFNESITPIARTFPSWLSILSGQYPQQNSIRTNLANQNQINSSTMLPRILQENGYETAYASDETRFSNITKKLGFDRIITPPIGLNDFIIGSLNDFPLSNFLVNTIVGKYLFPYNYANRAAFYTYNPDSFLNLLQPFLQEKRTKPLFFAIHFCLPHFPYLWADMSGNNLAIRERYAASVKRIDQQLNSFFSLLNEAHLLDHAIVVLLSDHGEALELPGDRLTEKELFQGKGSIPRFFPKSPYEEEVNQSAGHGTDVLGLTQYHTVLAFKLFGTQAQQPRLISGIVSLLDIKPTILEFLGIAAEHASGNSLSHVILEKGRVAPLKHFFMETDFTPDAIRTIYPEKRKV